MAITHGMLDPGNLQLYAPYYVAGKASVTVPAAGARLGTLVNFGRIDPLGGPGAPLLQVPLRISRARIFFNVASGAGLTPAFELVKGTATVQDNANGSERVVVRKKTAGYNAIATNEVSLYLSTAGTAVSGGNFAAVGEPFLIAGGASAATFGFSDGIWQPPDKMPLSLDVGEAVALQVTSQGTAAVGILGIVFDLLRQ